MVENCVQLAHTLNNKAKIPIFGIRGCVLIEQWDGTLCVRCIVAADFALQSEHKDLSQRKTRIVSNNGCIQCFTNTPFNTETDQVIDA